MNVFKTIGFLYRQRKLLQQAKQKRWTLQQQTEFFQTYYALLREGFSLKQIAIDLPLLYPHDQARFSKLAAELNKGQTLSASLRPFISRDVADQLWIAESHGMLLPCLQQLGKFYTQKQRQLQHLRAVLLYPLILIIMMLFLLFSITFWLKPELQLIQPDSTAPNMTLYWLKLTLLVILGGVFLSVLIYLSKIRQNFKKRHYISRWDWFCEIPIFGKLFRTYAYYYLAFNLGLLLNGGLDLKSICQLLDRFDQKSLLYQFNLNLQTLSASGSELRFLAEQKKYIPPEFRLFFSKGSTLKDLSHELLYYADLTYRRLLLELNRMIELVQPIMFIIIGLAIVFIYLSILLPMYQNIGGLNYGKE
jgi:competence protein ComGB